MQLKELSMEYGKALFLYSLNGNYLCSKIMKVQCSVNGVAVVPRLFLLPLAPNRFSQSKVIYMVIHVSKGRYNGFIWGYRERL